jgi:hypothetical protein
MAAPEKMEEEELQAPDNDPTTQKDTTGQRGV